MSIPEVNEHRFYKKLRNLKSGDSFLNTHRRGEVPSQHFSAITRNEATSLNNSEFQKVFLLLKKKKTSDRGRESF